MGTLTTTLALWGAALSTLLAVWNIYKDIRDRGNVRVEAELSEWTERDDETEDLVFRYEVEIILTNIGRRAALVRSVGVGRKSGPLLSIWRRLPPRFRLNQKPPKGYYEAVFDDKGCLPKRLEPGDFISIKRDNLKFLEDPEYGFLFAIDSLGHYYFLPKAGWDRMRRNYSPARTVTLDQGKVRF
jgi:hypothetical protein